MGVKGSYDYLNDGALEVYFDGSSNEFVILSALIKDEIIKLNPALLQHGHIDLRGKIFGKLKKGKPQIEFSIGAKKIDLTLPDHIGEFRDIGFEGRFQSGEPDDLSEAVLDIRNLTGN